MIVAEILLKALVFRFSSSEAKLDLAASRGGEPALSAVDPRRPLVGGRWETQSWTRRETFGLDIRFKVFFDAGFVVMMIVGPEL